MAYQGLTSFIKVLEENGELIRVMGFVDTEMMITEITDRFSKSAGGGKALLFENTGTEFPLLINALGSKKRIELAFGRDSLYDIENEIEGFFSFLVQPKDNIWEKLKALPRLKELSSWMPKKINRQGRCQEIVMQEPDLGKLPILKCWPADGGRFITLPCVQTIDPETKIPNMGMYRMQIFANNLTGMHWHKHKTGAIHFEKYKKRKEKMPVSVVLGGDPVYTYAATAPMPENIDEYLLAGFLRKKTVHLVKCLTNELYVPEDADFVIEGYVDTSEEYVLEGPFGDHTGFYSLVGEYPVFHVSCITYRKDAVYPATIVGIPPMEDAYIGKATERIFLKPLSLAIAPELKDMDLPFAGVAHNFAVIKIEKTYPGQAVKVTNSLWGAGQMMFNKIMIVVDEFVNVHDYKDLIKAFSDNFDPEYSLHFSKGPLDVLDHASKKFAYGSKLCIDLTQPFSEEMGIKKERIMPYNYELKKDLFLKIDGVCRVNNLQDKVNLPVILLNVNKYHPFSKEKLKSELIKILELSAYKVVIYYDEEVDPDDLNQLMWFIGGNIDPLRDISTLKISAEHEVLLVDATIKTKKNDDFTRDWPNVVVMDNETIALVDRKWDELGLGRFIESPSLRYKPFVKGKGAVRE